MVGADGVDKCIDEEVYSNVLYQIDKEIEIVRELMDKLICNNIIFNRRKILKLSRMLDELINLHYKNKPSE